MNPVFCTWLGPLLAAPFAGSVAGVLIRRLPEHRPVAVARSACESCQRPLSPLDLIPLVSYLALRGRCRACNAPIGRFHLLVELAAVIIALWAATAITAAPALWIDCGLGWTLLTLAWIDAEHLILPDVLTLPLIVAGLSVTWYAAPTMLAGHALGAIAGYGGFRAIALVYRALRGQEGLGEGDAKLLAAAGAWVGLAALPRLIVIAGLLGIAFITLSRARGRTGLNTPIAFGPALALALFIARLYV